ncbi:MAG: hypothetical protein KDA85_18305, partial [Planctomycetaceae bacterium]|nr:hypothetical protein [Planctomycetaceae bacterium]
VLSQSDTSIALVTTDHDGNGQTDLVRYRWDDGVLRRQVNGGTIVDICGELAEFELTLQADNRKEIVAAPAVVSDERLLASSSSPSSTSEEWLTHSSQSIGQHISSADFTSSSRLERGMQWMPTRYEIYGRQAGYSYYSTTITSELRVAAPDGSPTTDVLNITSINPATLSTSNGWLPVSIPATRWLSAEEGVCLQWHHGGGWNAAVFVTGHSSGRGMQRAALDTAVWTRPDADNGMLFRLYGKLRTPVHDHLEQSAARYVAATIVIQSDSQGSPMLHAGVDLANRPPVATILARSEFNTSAIAEDVNADGQADWTESAVTNGSTSDITNGQWVASNRRLQLQTVDVEGQLLDVRCRMRDSSALSGGAMLRLTVPNTSGQVVCSIALQLEKQTTGLQALTLLNETSANTYSTLQQFDSLPAELLDVRVTLNPERRVASFWLQGIPVAVHSVQNCTGTGNPSVVQLSAGQHTCEFDRIEVRATNL